MTTENNICYYSKGTKHELCPHQNWCIFNPERIKLEETINKLTKILKKAEKQYNQQLIDGDELIFTEEDLEVIKNDLKNLKEYEKKVKTWYWEELIYMKSSDYGYFLLSIIFILIAIINIIVLYVCSYIVGAVLGLTGLTYYCVVFLLWLILGGIIGKLI